MVYHADVLTGQISKLSMGYSGYGRPTNFEIQLSPQQSQFVIVDRGQGHGAQTAGGLGNFGPSGAVRSSLISSGWRLSFAGPNPPKPRVLSDLVSWTTWPDARYFSGQGIYETALNWTDPLPKQAMLRFEEVHEAAEVFVNGKSAGVIFMPPYSVDISGLLRPGRNEIKVTVGNLPINRFLGLPDQDLRPLRAAYGNRFPDPQEKLVVKEPAVSGLVGKVWLETVE